MTIQVIVRMVTVRVIVRMENKMMIIVNRETVIIIYDRYSQQSPTMRRHFETLNRMRILVGVGAHQ